MRVRSGFHDRRKGAHRLAHSLLRRDFPKRREYDGIFRDSVARTNPLRAQPELRRGFGDTHFHDIDRGLRMGFANLIGQPVVMHEDTPAGLDDDAQHRPQIGQRSQQADGAELSEIRVRVGMVEPELATIIVPPRLPPLQQHASSRVVQLAVVQNDETREADQIRPHVVVAGRVAELIDDEIVRIARGSSR